MFDFCNHTPEIFALTRPAVLPSDSELKWSNAFRRLLLAPELDLPILVIALIFPCCLERPESPQMGWNALHRHH